MIIGTYSNGSHIYYRVCFDIHEFRKLAHHLHGNDAALKYEGLIGDGLLVWFDLHGTGLRQVGTQFVALVNARFIGARFERGDAVRAKYEVITRNNRVAFQLEPLPQFDRDSLSPLRAKPIRLPTKEALVAPQVAPLPNEPSTADDQEVLAAASLLNESVAPRVDLRLVVDEDGRRVRVIRRRVLEESLD